MGASTNHKQSLLFFLVCQAKRARHENDHARDGNQEKKRDCTQSRTSMKFRNSSGIMYQPPKAANSESNKGRYYRNSTVLIKMNSWE